MNKEEVMRVLTKEVGTSFYDCQSSNLVCYGYRAEDKSLWIVFKGNKVYQYTPLERVQFEELQAAESKGKWVNANLVKSKVNYKVYEIV